MKAKITEKLDVITLVKSTSQHKNSCYHFDYNVSMYDKYRHYCSIIIHYDFLTHLYATHNHTLCCYDYKPRIKAFTAVKPEITEQINRELDKYEKQQEVKVKNRKEVIKEIINDLKQLFMSNQYL